MFEVEVWDKALTGRVWCGEWETLTVTPRHNQQSTAALTVPLDAHVVPDLMPKGTRLLIRYAGEHTLSGPIRTWHTSTGTTAERVLTCEAEDDWRLLRRLLGWQVPSAAITAQGAAEYAVYTGPAETVVKALLAANLTRLGGALTQPVTIAPDQGRGSEIEVSVRMHTVGDRLYPLLDQAGVGVTVQQTAAGLRVDCYEGDTYPHVLSEAAGTLTENGWKYTGPALTRAVLGFDGEGTARHYRAVADTSLEAEWGDLIEGFVDSNLKHDEAGFEAAALTRGQQALAEAGPTAGLSLNLAETDTFRYGGPGGLHVGDVVTVEVAAGVTVTDVLREAVITSTAAEGITVTPTVGERPDTDSLVIRTVGNVARAIRDLRARR